MTASLTVLPDVTGWAAPDARSYLESAGIQVQTRVLLTDESPKGSVVKQRPEAGTPVPAVVRLVVARKPVVHYLSALTPLRDAAPEAGSRRLGGRQYPHSISFYGCDDDGWFSNSDAYEIPGRYRRFVATLGAGRETPLDVTVQFRVSVDGRVKVA